MGNWELGIGNWEWEKRNGFLCGCRYLVINLGLWLDVAPKLEIDTKA
ncbi:hypothetical protein [Nostoc sp. CMAA1605]|nr:hypothetical protein [Nostoc sp. CMAA1605]